MVFTAVYKFSMNIIFIYTYILFCTKKNLYVMSSNTFLFFVTCFIYTYVHTCIYKQNILIRRETIVIAAPCPNLVKIILNIYNLK